MDMLAKAIQIAAEAHYDQKDKAGAPYILHPLRVMMGMDTETEKIVAILHDVIEDTDRTEATLREAGFPDEIITAVLCLTRFDDEADYDEYIRKIKDNPIARKVKLADLKDNMDITRLSILSDKTIQRLEKYHRSWRQLTQ
ncbi:HD domain-containing protein [Desulfatiferula olefinivorans]